MKLYILRAEERVRYDAVAQNVQRNLQWAVVTTPRWEVPVLDNDFDPQTLTVVAARGNVLLLYPPGGASILPPSSDQLLSATVELARRAAEGKQP